MEAVAQADADYLTGLGQGVKGNAVAEAMHSNLLVPPCATLLLSRRIFTMHCPAHYLPTPPPPYV